MADMTNEEREAREDLRDLLDLVAEKWPGEALAMIRAARDAASEHDLCGGQYDTCFIGYMLPHCSEVNLDDRARDYFYLFRSEGFDDAPARPIELFIVGVLPEWVGEDFFDGALTLAESNRRCDLVAAWTDAWLADHDYTEV